MRGQKGFNERFDLAPLAKSSQNSFCKAVLVLFGNWWRNHDIFLLIFISLQNLPQPCFCLHRARNCISMDSFLLWSQGWKPSEVSQANTFHPLSSALQWPKQRFRQDADIPPPRDYCKVQCLTHSFSLALKLYKVAPYRNPLRSILSSNPYCLINWISISTDRHFTIQISGKAVVCIYEWRKQVAFASRYKMVLTISFHNHSVLLLADIWGWMATNS